MKSYSDRLTQTPSTPIDTAGIAPLRTRRTLIQAVWRALRVDVALALTMPTLAGACFGLWQTGQAQPISFAFVFASVFACALSYQALTGFFDYRRSLAPDARPAVDLPDTAFGLLVSGTVAPGMLLSLGMLLLSIGVLCALWLALLAGWPVLFFGGLSLLLMVTALFPPIHYVYRGWGLGEVGSTLSFGVLPLLGGYYVQTQSLSWLPLIGGLPLTLLVLLIVLNQNIGAWHRDWLIGKRTLAVILGGARALDLSIVLTITAYTSILLVTVLARLPLWLLAGLATLPLCMGAFADIRRSEVVAEDGYRLRDATAKAAIWTGILTCAALLIGRAG